MKLPKQLQNPEFRFVLLGKWDCWKHKETGEITEMPSEVYKELKKLNQWMPLGKAPFEKNWQEKGYAYNSAELINHLKTKNFGVIGGYGNLRILDIDDVKLAEEILKKTKTYTIKTGGGGMHFYFLSDYETNHVLINELGELRAKNYQVVSAPCKHPSGNNYEIIRDIPIDEISEEDLIAIIKPYLRDAIPIIETKERPKDTSGSGLEYRRVLALLREGKSKEQIFIEMNKYAKWATHGTRFPQYRELTYKNAKEFYEYEKVQTGGKNPDEKYKLIWEDDLQNSEIEEKEWLIDKLIPHKAVCVLTGKRGTMKTFLALQMAYSVATGNEFLGKFHTQQGGVLYLDKENGLNIMKKRTKMIKSGLNLDAPSKIGFICFSQLKIDKNTDIWEIEKEIQKNEIKLLIVDTYRRAISFDENDAGAVSQLFVDNLRPIAERSDFSILLIHHNRKSGSGFGDEMDEIRGSSDLANYADIILKTERKGTNLVLKQLKNRNAQEEEPIKIETKFEEDKLEMLYGGDFKELTQVGRCVEILSVWVAEQGIKTFTSKQAQEVAFKRGVKKNNFFGALDDMINLGIIKKVLRGTYEVV